MKPVYTITILFLISVVLSACPFKSTVGIDDKPGLPIKTSFLGTWHSAAYPKDSTEIKFTKLDNYQYEVLAYTSNGKEGYDTSHYRAWFSAVNKKQLMSFYEYNEKFYNFAEADITKNKLTIKFLSEDITKEEFTSTAALRHFMEDLYKNQNVLYDADVVLEDLIKVE